MDVYLRKDLLEFLTPLPSMQTEKGRQAILLAAGLDTILAHIDLSGNTREMVISLVNALEHYGTTETSELALVLFLQEVASQLGTDKQTTIQQLCEQIITDAQHKNVSTLRHLTIYTTSRPTEPEQTPIPTDIAIEPGIAPEPDIGPNPYNGLAAFQETDADRFFGRERFIQALWDRLCALHTRPLGGPAPVRLFVILGPSGSGKSSVARAGLLPKFAAQPLPGAQHAQVALVIPGTHPLDALALSLARIDTSPQTLTTTTAEFTTALKQEAEGQCDGLRRIVDTLPGITTRPLILLIDQFEEVYNTEVKPDERRLFLDNLLCAAADPSGCMSIILTLRSDFLGQTQRHPRFNQAIAEHTVVIPVMNDTELRDAIAKPAEHAGQAPDTATVDLLIEQSHDREGALPLLQFALTRIWEGLLQGVAPADTLKQIGGVGGALAGEAQRLFDELSAGDQAIARRAFLALVQLGEGTQDTRRRITLTDIVARGEEPAHVQAVIRCFADPRVRLVTLSATADGVETAEITHEALLDHWDTLREWLDANRDDLRFHRHLNADATYWTSQGKADGLLWRPPDLDLLRQYQTQSGADMTAVEVEFFESSMRQEQHSKRMQRMAVTALVVLTVIAIGAAGAALLAYNNANTQKTKALRLYHVSVVQSLVTYADQHFLKGERERAALLARQAYFLNDIYQADIEDQISDVLRRSLVLPEAETDVLLEQVCQQARRNLTPDEWQRVVKNEDIPPQPCPGLSSADRAANIVLRLRSEPMNTAEKQHLTLYVKANWVVGTYIENRFEAQQEGQVIVDHATGLMWQQSGSKESLTYEDAQQYIEHLNAEKFAGYDGWRLPTVEELVSLVGPEQSSNGYYIDTIFTVPTDGWYWCWSADKFPSDGGLPSAAWRVTFNTGSVGWHILDSTVCVRAVRS